MLLNEIKFDWDQWNVQKNELKHGVSSLEAESCFYDEDLKIYEDSKHSITKERRLVLYGRSVKSRILMVGFTIRQKKVRIITARPASQKERKIYEEKEA